MKELSVIEMESIAGAYSWDFSSLGSALTSIVSNGVEAVASAVTLGSILASYGSLLVELMAAITAGSSALVPLVWPLVAYGG